LLNEAALRLAQAAAKESDMKAMISALSALGFLAAMSASPPAAAEDAPAATAAKTVKGPTIKHDPIKHVAIKHEPIRHVAKKNAGAAGQSGSLAQAGSPGGQNSQGNIDPATAKPNYTPKFKTNP
jgi:hypothetical protein